MKNKIKLTNSGKCLKYKIFAFLIYALPMTALFIFNIDEYRNNDGTMIGFWGIVLFGFIILAFKNQVISFFTKRTMMTISLIFFIFSLLTRCMADKMLLIATVSLCSSLLSSFVEVVADTYNTMAYKLIDGVKMKNPDLALDEKTAWRISYGFIVVKEEVTE